MKNTQRRYELSYLADINADNVQARVANAEKYVREQIADAARLIMNGGYKIVLLSGGSGSCKTSTMLAIDAVLERYGKCSTEVSMDDFYLDRDQCPLLPDGSRDIESIASLDVNLLNEVLDSLAHSKTTVIPTFDFSAQKRGKATKSVTPLDGGVIMLEGINALNPSIAEGISPDKVLRIHVNPYAEVYEQGKLLLSQRDIRFVRRTVRDCFYRGASPQNTLDMWSGVTQGEIHNILPYVGLANICIQTFYDYELSVFKECERQIVFPRCCGVHTAMLENVAYVFEHIGALSPNVIPKDSLLQEFIKI